LTRSRQRTQNRSGKSRRSALQVDAELAEALDAGVARGLLVEDRRYFLGGSGDDSGSAEADGDN
jgi:hypothetical protein